MKKINTYLIVILLGLLCISCHHTDRDKLIVDAVTDVDGHTYNAVRIGNQVWMASNLYATMYEDHGIIANASTGGASGQTKYRIRPNGSSTLVKEYGLLYSWPAVTRDEAWKDDEHPVQGVCPKGWHVPSINEWKELVNYINNHPSYIQNSSSFVKAISSNQAWDTSSVTRSPGYQQETNNSTQLGILPAGYCNGNHFYEFGQCACFWTPNRYKWDRELYYYVSIHYNEDSLAYDLVYQHSSVFPSGNAHSVRCVKN